MTNTPLPIPPGFQPIEAGGPYMQNNGPLYLLHQGDVVKFGFRVEQRHINPMNKIGRAHV